MPDMIETLFRDLQTLVMASEIKYNKEALKYETVESRREADKYIFAKNKEDVFSSYVYYSKEAIRNAGITDPDTIEAFSKDRSLIPYEWRELVLKEQRRLIVDRYVEMNNYYRKLNGLPDTDDHLDIFIDNDIAIKYNLDNSVPIHLMSREDIIVLNKKGELSKIISKYPNKKYLNYLGDKKIDIVRARSANNFSLLRIDTSVNESLIERFVTAYEQCREYFMSVIYNSNFGNSYALYDNFIALMIMIMTIQRVVSQTFKMGVNRDFYDLQSFKMLFEMYSVPFLEELPIEYQRILARNINRLLKYKSTDRVIFDICELLGFERVKVFKHYLVKEHLMDNDMPVFLYKEVQNEDGTTSIVEDHEKMYKLYFQPVELREKNVFLALNDQNQRIAYDVNIVDDEYWWDDDEELQKLLYESEFNYVESKYMSINAMYKLTEMIFEITYIFRLIVDKKSDTEKVFMKLPQLFGDKDIDIFKVIILLSALICKKSGMKGNIISTPTKILTILGFNFKENIRRIREDILNHPEILDNQLLDYIEYMDIDKPGDINTLFKNIKGFNDFIIDKLATTQNLQEYRAYERIYKSLLIMEESNDAFKMSNGQIAETYYEYLVDSDIEIGMFIENIDMAKIDEIIAHIIFRVELLIPNLKYMYTLSDTDTGIFRALVKLIRFFKSYTVELKDFNILYIMDNRYHNMIKLIGDIKAFEKNLYHAEPIAPKFIIDELTMKTKLNGKDLLQLLDKIAITGRNIFKDFSMIDEEVAHLYKTVSDETRMKMLDKLSEIKKNMIKDYFSYAEKPILLGLLLLKEMIDLNDTSLSKVSATLYETLLDSFNDGKSLDKFNKIVLNIKPDEKLSMESTFKDSNDFLLRDSMKTLSRHYNNDKIDSENILSVLIFNTINMLIQTYNSIYHINKNITDSDRITLNNTGKFKRRYWNEDHVRIVDKISLLVGNMLETIMVLKDSFELANFIDTSERLDSDHTITKNKISDLLQSFVMVDGLCSIITNNYRSKIRMSDSIDHRSVYKNYDWLVTENSLGKNIWSDVLYTVDSMINLLNSSETNKLNIVNETLSTKHRSNILYSIDKSDDIDQKDAMKASSYVDIIEKIESVNNNIHSIDVTNVYDERILNDNKIMGKKQLSVVSDNINISDISETDSNIIIKSIDKLIESTKQIKTYEIVDQNKILENISDTSKNNVISDHSKYIYDVGIVTRMVDEDINILRNKMNTTTKNNRTDIVDLSYDNKISVINDVSDNQKIVPTIINNKSDILMVEAIEDRTSLKYNKDIQDIDSLQSINSISQESIVYDNDNISIINENNLQKVIDILDTMIYKFMDVNISLKKQVTGSDSVKMRDILKVIYN